MEETKVKNVFTNKNFVLAFLGAFVSNTGNLLYSFAVSFYILLLTNNNAFLQGLYLAVGGITFTIVVLFGGVIGDRFHKGKIMYICDYAKGIVLLLMTILLMTFIKDNDGKVVCLFILTIIGNFIAGIFTPASSSLLPHIVPKESYQQAQSYYSIMQSIQGILGLVLAGVLYSLLPINILFIIVAVLYLLSGFSEMFIKYDYVKPTNKLTIKNVFQDIGDAFKYLVNLKSIFYLIIFILFVNFFFSPIGNNFLPYFVSTDIASSNYLFKEYIKPEMWSTILSIGFSLGSIIFAFILSMKPTKDYIAKGLKRAFMLVTICLLLLTSTYILYRYEILSINFNLIFNFFNNFMIGMLIVNINIPISTKLITMVDKDKLGKVNSLVDIGSQGFIPLSSFLSGIAINAFGLAGLLISCSIGFILITLLLVLNKEVAKL